MDLRTQWAPRTELPALRPAGSADLASVSSLASTQGSHGAEAVLSLFLLPLDGDSGAGLTCTPIPCCLLDISARPGWSYLQGAPPPFSSCRRDIAGTTGGTCEIPDGEGKAGRRCVGEPALLTAPLLPPLPLLYSSCPAGLQPGTSPSFLHNPKAVWGPGWGGRFQRASSSIHRKPAPLSRGLVSIPETMAVSSSLYCEREEGPCLAHLPFQEQFLPCTCVLETTSCPHLKAESRTL